MAPPQLTYEQALEYIASLAPRGWRFGLDRMEELVRRANLRGSLGDGQAPRFIHVTGTNGKGSVTAYLQSIFVESGYRTGAFFSPFVYDIRERIQFGRNLISRDDFAQLTSDLIPFAESLTSTEFEGVTEFEFKTAMGFEYWKRKNAEWVALEVGLGGKLDATNVITPEASVIVSIGLDHTSILGNSLEEIAAEKAGIIKPGKPVVVGQMATEALGVIEAVALEKGSSLWHYGKEITFEAGTLRTPTVTVTDLAPSLTGTMQSHNAAIAAAAVIAAGAFKDEDSLREGLAGAMLPGRFETRVYKGKTIIMDGAHNAAAARVLCESIGAAYPGKSVHLVSSMVAGHDPLLFYRELAPLIKAAYVAPISFHRAQPVETISDALRSLTPTVSSHASPLAALEAAVAATDKDEVVVVTGSFYLVGEVGRALNR